MKKYTKNRESQSRTVEINSNGFRQPPISEILQAYRNGTLGRSPIQRESIEEDDDLIQTKTSGQPPVSAILQQYGEKRQKYASEEDEEIVQGKFDTAQRQEKPNNTGLPDNLKSGVENLSGYSMDDVKVHYNSDKPAQLNALAYAQGTDIHVAPGQEKHLPHEAWHVVQQKQGRVHPTVQLQGVNVNDNEGLEKEADEKGMASLAKSIEKAIPKKQIKIQKKKRDDLTSDNVVQLITYKSVEYSRDKNNYNKFNDEANRDLDNLVLERNKERDQKMLNVIGNSDYIVNTPAELIAIIYPHDKGYQAVLNEEFEYLGPIILEIIELAKGAHEMSPELKEDESTESHEYIIMNMVEVRKKTDKIKKYIQWRKINAIPPLAKEVEEAAIFSMLTFLEYVDADHPPTKKNISYKEKEIAKGEKKMLENTEKIAQTACSIEPEVRQSGDEQYLRGAVGAKADEFGGSHLTIGKKSETKLLKDTVPQEAKGILWASVWSEGVNKAFIEGGTDKKHEFRLISQLPVELVPALKAGDINEFIRISKEETIKNKGADPWRAYYHLEKGKLTTLGREIVQILEAGYVLE